MIPGSVSQPRCSITDNGEGTHPLKSDSSPRSRRSSTDKPHAKDADPGTIAAEILAEHSISGLPLFRFWGGSWWQWSRGRYAEMPEAELRAAVLSHFKRGWSHVKREHVANVVEHLRAETILSSDTSPPIWLSGEPNDFAPHECFATASKIVHLPSLAEKQKLHSVPATPAFFTLNACDCDVDLNAPHPKLWHSFLNELWPDDRESIDTLQEIFGYLLTADTRYQKIFGLIGPPRSGKGTIVRMLRKLLGERNVAGPTLAGIATNFGLSPLVGKSLAVVSDARLSGRADQALVVERLLSISGEDKLTIDRKHSSAIHCQLSARLLILSNELPRLPDASGTIVSRFILQRTTRSFLGCEDTELDAKLAAELPGILLWAIDGWRRLRNRGRFVQPAAGREMLSSMTRLASPVSSFVLSCCELRPDAACSKQSLYAAYQQWCVMEGVERRTTAEVFSRDLRAAYPEIDSQRLRTESEGARERCYTGIKISANFHNDGLSF